MTVNRAGSGGYAEWDWIVTGRWNRLHAPENWDDPEYNGYDEDARTACGLRGCCRIRRYPQGNGSPKNDDRCRPLVEAREATS